MYFLMELSAYLHAGLQACRHTQWYTLLNAPVLDEAAASSIRNIVLYSRNKCYCLPGMENGLFIWWYSGRRAVEMYKRQLI